MERARLASPYSIEAKQAVPKKISAHKLQSLPWLAMPNINAPISNKTAIELQYFTNLDFFIQLGALKLDADMLADLGTVGTPVKSEQANMTGIGNHQSFQHF